MSLSTTKPGTPPAPEAETNIQTVDFRGKTVRFDATGYQHVQLRNDGVLMGSNDLVAWVALKPVEDKKA